MKKTAVILLSAVLALGAAGCTENAGEGGGAAGEVFVWSVPDTVKVLQDRVYEGEKESAAISVTAVRNEYEGAQLIMTAESDVSSYTVETASLTDGDGHTYAGENVEVYNQKYIDVSLTTTNSFSPGSYPDALLPFETAAEYGENGIEAGQNQAVYFSFYIPKTQEAGTYTGSFTLIVDGAESTVPVTLRVVDYTLDDEVHSRSSFGVHRYWNEGGIISAEKDASYEMYAAYYEYLLEHRISTRYLPAAMSDTEGFIEQLRKYGQDPRCSNYIIPYVEAYDASFGGTGIDYALYEETLDAIAEASIQDGYNYLAKASTYFAMFDEITSSQMISRANRFYKKIYELHGEIANKWRASLSGEMKEEMIETLLSLNHLMVTTFDTRFDVGVTWCPLLDKYNSESSRGLYGETYKIATESGNTVTQNAEKWWYSAGIPKNPYPSYHIDDDGYSPVVYSWMQYAYGVTGNLYWSATFYLERVSENGSVVYNALQDCYDTAMRFPSTNGDGFLVYPGAPYGIYGPVGSVRLERLRDGLEEYDLLYALEQYYAGKPGADFAGVMELLYDKLFDGTRVSTDTQTYEEMRSVLLSMLDMAENTGVLVLNVETQDNVTQAEVFVPTGVTAEFGGEKADETPAEGGSVVTVTQQLSGSANVFSVTAGGVTVSFGLGGERLLFGAQQLTQYILAAGEGDTVAASEYQGVPVAQLDLQAAEGGQSFTFAKEIYGVFGAGSERMTLRFYSDTACEATLYIAGTSGLAIPVYTAQLSVGFNEISVAASGINWDSVGTSGGMYMRVGGDGAKVLRFTEIEIM